MNHCLRMYYHPRGLRVAAVLSFGFVCILFLVADRRLVIILDAELADDLLLIQLSPSLPNITKVQGLRDNATASDDKRASKSHLHLLIPATTSNRDLCRLLFSATILNYPVPTLLNWGAPEDSDPFVQHLAKVNKILTYLKGIPPGNEDDLVLIVDGYDVWFQLRSDVLIRRYFAVMQAADSRVALELDANVARKNDVRNTILFAADKLCWPFRDGRRPACWAVPQSTLPANSFEPFDDSTASLAAGNAAQSRARWLNSGLLMGPVGDIRALFEATLKSIQSNYVIGSDQFYIANLFGEQEYLRRLLKPDPDLPSAGSVEIPSIDPGKRTEFHIALDYESTIFQDIGAYGKFISWLRFNGSEGAANLLQDGTPITLHGFALHDDIAASPPPFSNEKNAHWAFGDDKGQTEIISILNSLPLDLSWRDIPLATNLVTKKAFALIHFTFEKELRDAWWDIMWFYPHGRQLLQASITPSKAPILEVPIGGHMWWNTEGSHLAKDEQRGKSTKGEKGGAWNDRGMWLLWKGMCSPFDEAVFGSQ